MRAMNIIHQVRVDGDSKALLQIIRQFNTACNWLSQVAFQERLFHWLPLQRRTYHEVRARFGLTSAQAVVAIRKAAYVYKDKARRNTLAEFRPLGSMPLYKHCYFGDKTVRIYGQRFPIMSQPDLPLSSVHQGTLSFRDRKFYIQQVIDVPEPELYQSDDYLGIDLGIVNIAADSDGVLYAGGQLNGLRKRYFKLRQKLQKKGSRSAKRLLMKRRLKEARFARAVNHNISKALVSKAQRHSLSLALEDLKGIRERITVRRGQRRQAHAWAFYQLRSFIEYKAKLAGVPVVLVNPRNTSRMCPSCGHISKANRKTQALFTCVSCGLAGTADTIAAQNIRVLGRASGDRPYAPPGGRASPCFNGIIA